MKESYVKESATYNGPESRVAFREGSPEALIGDRAGRVFSRERNNLRDADAVEEGNTGRIDTEMRSSPAWSETPCRYGNTSHENREILCSSAPDGAAGRDGTSKDAHRR